jgi:hypothetical protein
VGGERKKCRWLMAVRRKLNSQNAGPNVDHGCRASSIDTQRVQAREEKDSQEPQHQGRMYKAGRKGGCGTTNKPMNYLVQAVQVQLRTPYGGNVLCTT